MRKIILFILLLVSARSIAQYPPGYTGISARYQWIAGIFKDGLHVPQICGFPVSRAGVWVGDGQVMMDTCGNKLYIRSGGSWRALVDSASAGCDTCFSSKYILPDSSGLVLVKVNGDEDTTTFGVIDQRFGKSTGDYNITENRTPNFHDTHTMTFDSVNTFGVTRSGINRLYVNNTSTGGFSPDGLNSFQVSNSLSQLTANNLSVSVQANPDSIVLQQPAGNYSIYNLPQRVDTTANKIMVWNATTKKFGWSFYYSGAAGSSNNWTFDALNAPSTGFPVFGTSSNKSINIFTNNTYRGVIDSTGKWAIGNTAGTYSAATVSIGPTPGLDASVRLHVDGRVNVNGVLLSGYYDAIRIGTWDAIGIPSAGGGTRLAYGYRSGQFTGHDFSTNGTLRASIDGNGLLVPVLAGTGTRVTTASSTGQLGAIANTTDGFVLTLASGVPVWEKKVTQFKNVTIENPSASENISFFYTDKAITITKLADVVRGSSPSVTYDIHHSTDRSSGSPNELLGTDRTTTSTTGTTSTTFNDATIPAGSWVWVITSATSGTNNEIAITLTYTEDL